MAWELATTGHAMGVVKFIFTPLQAGPVEP
jgi:hypothetical protein